MCFCTKWCQSSARLDRKTAVITGGNCGIGQETAKDIYKRGAKVILLCRNEEKATAAITEIKEQCKNLHNVGFIKYKYLDLAALSSVRNCANDLLKEEEQIHLLINNAGVYNSPEARTVDGFETHFGVNYLGHVLLTLILLPKIIQSAPARIVNVSSLFANYTWLGGGNLDIDDFNFEKRNYKPLKAYSQSKLAMIAFTKELSRKLKEADITNVTVYSLHPGIIPTEMGRNLDYHFSGASWLWYNIGPYFFKTTEGGIQTTIYCAVDENIANESGLYYSDCRLTEPVPIAFDKEVGLRLWEMSIRLLKLENFNPFNKTCSIVTQQPFTI